jgi:hypothetical protein
VADTKETAIIAAITTRPGQDHQDEQGQAHTSDSGIFFSTIVCLVADTKETAIIAAITTRPGQDHQDEQGCTGKAVLFSVTIALELKPFCPLGTVPLRSNPLVIKMYVSD